MGPAFVGYDRAEAFMAADAPLLVVDSDLVIRDVNPAYLRATDRAEAELLGTPMFEAFPDNPGDPQADGVANLRASFRRVFCDGHRDRLPLQRYDIPVRASPQAFARRFWNLVNSPLRDNAGRLIGALHHAEDVTPVADLLVSYGWSSPAGLTVDEPTRGLLVAALAREVLAHQQARATARQLQQALNSRVVIEQAKGIIAGREGISVHEAFARLRRHAREHCAALSEVARAVVERGLQV
jgi:response regulator NasT